MTDKPEIIEDEVAMDPLIALLHQKYAFSSHYTTAQEKAATKTAILDEVVKHNMRPYYEMVCEAFGWPLDNKLVEKMNTANEKRVQELDATIKDAQENLGDIEVREALLAKCDFFSRIGDVDTCLEFNEECGKKTIAVGPKLDLCFQRIRLGIAFSSNEIAAKGIQDAHRLIKDGDWERRNRLQVYEGLYHVFIRNFDKGSKLLLDSLTTFAATELLNFKQFIFLTVTSALVTLNRGDLKKKVIDSPEVLSAGLTELNELVSAIYQCRYSSVFPSLEKVCNQFHSSVFLTLHVNFFFREVRVLIFNQFLDSYSSVTMKSMSSAFSIPLPVLDSMLFTLVSNERISCKVDRISGNITTYRGDTTNFHYHKIVKNGDVLLNRIQKLSRLVEM